MKDNFLAKYEITEPRESQPQPVIMMSGQGWGKTSFGGTLSDVLLEVEVPVVTNAQCKTAMSGITDSMICAGGVAGKDGCQVKIRF